MEFNIKARYVALASLSCLLASQSSTAGGLEYTKQSIAPLFEPENYAEISYANVSVNIEGKDITGQPIKNMMEDFALPSVAIKVTPTPNTAFAMLYERPFGVETKYPKGNIFDNALGTTEAHVSTDNLTLLGGGKTDSNVWLYGGVQMQKAKANISAASPPTTALPYYTYYKATPTKVDNAIAPVVGIAYEVPNIALRTAMTYRGSTKHKVNLTETMHLADPAEEATAIPYLEKTPARLDMVFPQSINLDFQTGIAKDTLLTVNGRWVNWKKFKITTPFTLETTGEPIAYYPKDSYAVEVALGRQFTPKFSSEVRLGYDSGTGTPLSLIGPYDTTKSIALGGQYNITPKLLVAGGVQYLLLEGGEVKTKKDGLIAKVKDGNGYAVGMKVGYHF